MQRSTAGREGPRLLQQQLFIVRNFSPLEADFSRYYGVDLAQACWGPEPKSLRWLFARIEHLPRESALARHLNEHVDWGTAEELQAATLEAIERNTYTLRKAHFHGSPPKPMTVPRPGQRGAPAEHAGTPRRVTTEELVSLVPEYEAGDGA